MKHSDIDKRIEELTAEARELERQRETLAALDVCNAQGHDVFLTGVDGTLMDVHSITIKCKVCGAMNQLRQHKSWQLLNEASEVIANIADFYETEPTEPLPEPEPVRTAPAEQKDEPHVIRDDGTMKTLDETDSTGFYRVKFGE